MISNIPVCISTDWGQKDRRRAKLENVSVTPVERSNQKETNPFTIAASAKSSLTAGKFHDQAENVEKLYHYLIVTEKTPHTPQGRPTPRQLIGRPGVSHPQGISL
jgi:hypothetical protein